MKKYLVIYERQFEGYSSDSDYVGNAKFFCEFRSAYDLDKVSKASVDRLKLVFKADQYKRKYTGEGRFCETVTEEQLRTKWGIIAEGGYLIDTPVLEETGIPETMDGEPL